LVGNKTLLPVSILANTGRKKDIILLCLLGFHDLLDRRDGPGLKPPHRIDADVLPHLILRAKLDETVWRSGFREAVEQLKYASRDFKLVFRDDDHPILIEAQL
jgi:hypothetical protein